VRTRAAVVAAQAVGLPDHAHQRLGARQASRARAANLAAPACEAHKSMEHPDGRA
jgi:hypothetical protein